VTLEAPVPFILATIPMMRIYLRPDRKAFFLHPAVRLPLQKDINYQPGPGLTNKPEYEVPLNVRGPQILSNERLSTLEKHLSREKLEEGAEGLNKQYDICAILYQVREHRSL